VRDLPGKVAVVTGAASGIGKAMCNAFVARGMKVVMADVEEPALQGACAELAEGGAEVVASYCDVSDQSSVEALAEESFSRFGAVHLVCNNAGVASGGPSWEQPLSAWEWVLGVNLWGVVHGVRSFLPRLIDQGEGHVVNTASMAGLIPLPMAAPYSVSKHGVVALSETLYFELKLLGKPVGVSVLCPGWVSTQIGDAERNWPAKLGAPPTEGEDASVAAASRDLMRTVIASGMDPAEVASKVVDAVIEGRFWILTHPEMGKAVTERYRRAVSGEEPDFGFGGLIPGLP